MTSLVSSCPAGMVGVADRPKVTVCVVPAAAVAPLDWTATVTAPTDRAVVLGRLDSRMRSPAPEVLLWTTIRMVCALKVWPPLTMLGPQVAERGRSVRLHCWLVVFLQVHWMVAWSSAVEPPETSRHRPLRAETIAEPLEVQLWLLAPVQGHWMIAVPGSKEPLWTSMHLPLLMLTSEKVPSLWSTASHNWPGPPAAVFCTTAVPLARESDSTAAFLPLLAAVR